MGINRRSFLSLVGVATLPGCGAPVSAPGEKNSQNGSRQSGAERGPRVLWESEIGGFFAINRPVMTGDTLFVQSDANVYALNTETGTEQWTTDVGSRPNYFSPAAWGDSVFVASTFQDGAVYALSASTGAVRWDVDGGIVRSPAAEDGRVYFSSKESGDCSVRAVSAEDGSDEWTATIGENKRCNPASRPVVHDGRVFVAVNIRDDGIERRGALHVFDAEDGARLWTHSIDGSIDTNPAIADGMAFVPASNGGALYAIDVESRTEAWTHDRETSTRNYWTPPEVADGRVYAGNIGGVTAFDAEEGTIEWDLRRNLVSRNGLTVASGTVYTAGKWLAAVSADDGTLQWLFKREEMASTAFSPPVVENGVAYAGACLKRHPDERYFHVVDALRRS